MNEKEIDQSIERAKKKGINKALIPGRKRVKKVLWMGTKCPLKDVNELLDELGSHDRVTALTENRRSEVTDRLIKMREDGQEEDGFALFMENAEHLDYDNATDHEDFNEAWWWSRLYIQEIYKNKQELNFWKEKRNEQDV